MGVSSCICMLRLMDHHTEEGAGGFVGSDAHVSLRLPGTKSITASARWEHAFDINMVGTSPKRIETSCNPAAIIDLMLLAGPFGLSKSWTSSFPSGRCLLTNKENL